MTIDFEEIPLDLHRPGVFVEIDESLAFQGLPVFAQRMVVLGQMFTAGGDAGTATPLTPVAVNRVEEADILFGVGSMAARSVRAIRANNAHHELIVVPVADDGAGVAATGTVEITAAPARAGTAAFRIAGQRVRIKVLPTDTVTEIAAALAAAVNADKQLPVTAGAALGVVTLTARHAGEAGNHIDLRDGYWLDGPQPQGLGVTITAMANGAGNPDAGPALAALDALETYQTFAVPWTDAANLTAIEEELADRWMALRAVDGVMFTAFTGGYAAAATLAEGRNSAFNVLVCPGRTPTPPWELAGAMAGQTTYAAAVDPGRPFQTLPLDGVLPPAEGIERFDDLERNLILTKGGATTSVDAAGRVVIERAVTTYKETASGAADPSLQDLNTVRLMSYYRRSVVNTWARMFPRHKLAEDGQPVGLGQSIMTPSGAIAVQTAHYERLVNAGLFQDLAGYKQSLIAEVNASIPGRLDIFDRPRPIGQLRQVAARAAFRL